MVMRQHQWPTQNQEWQIGFCNSSKLLKDSVDKQYYRNVFRNSSCREEQADDIFPDLDKTPVVTSGQAPAPGKPSPEPDALAETREPTQGADPGESLGGGERIDAAEEGRRTRLRQVGLLF